MRSGRVGNEVTEWAKEREARVYVRLRPLNLGVIEKLARPAYSVDDDGSLLLDSPDSEERSVFRVNGK